jgi:Mrp family chromosome partitioning ATPase
MSEVSSSSLQRQMRQDDPRRWLEWTLTELIEELERLGHPGALERATECRHMQATVEAWPADMHPPEDTERMIARVDSIRDELDRPPEKKVHKAEIVRAEGTTYSIADPSAGARRRSTRPRASSMKSTVASFPPVRRPVKDLPVEPLAAPRTPPPVAVKRRREDVAPMTRRGHSLASDSPPPAAPPTVRGSAPPGWRAKAPSQPERERKSPPSANQLAVREPAAPVVVERSPEPARVVKRRSSDKASLPPLSHAEVGRLVFEHLADDGPVDERLVMLSASESEQAEAYRTLFYRLGATSDARTILVTTSSEEEDSSVCAANLALAIALAGDDRVLLIETRFKQPRQARLFGYVPSECFGRRLIKHRREGNAAWQIAQLGETNLCLLTIDPEQTTTPALDAQALAEVVGRFKKAGFGYLILDGPPAIPGSDAGYVSRCVEGALIAVNDKQSRSRQLRRSVEVLGDTPVLGMVMLEQG